MLQAISKVIVPATPQYKPNTSDSKHQHNQDLVRNEEYKRMKQQSATASHSCHIRPWRARNTIRLCTAMTNRSLTTPSRRAGPRTAHRARDTLCDSIYMRFSYCLCLPDGGRCGAGQWRWWSRRSTTRCLEPDRKALVLSKIRRDINVILGICCWTSMKLCWTLVGQCPRFINAEARCRGFALIALDLGYRCFYNMINSSRSSMLCVCVIHRPNKCKCHLQRGWFYGVSTCYNAPKAVGISNTSICVDEKFRRRIRPIKTDLSIRQLPSRARHRTCGRYFKSTALMSIRRLASSIDIADPTGMNWNKTADDNDKTQGLPHG